MKEELLKIIRRIIGSTSKLGAFVILILCATFAFNTNDFSALEKGIAAFTALVGVKTIADAFGKNKE